MGLYVSVSRQLVVNQSGPDPTRWRSMAVIGVAQLLLILDMTIVNVALPTVQQSLHIEDADRHWVITAYTLTFGGLLLLGGRIADYTGRKRAFVGGLIGFAVASAAGGLAVNAGMLYAARALQGAFGALLAPAALSLLTVAFTDPQERAKAFALYGGIAGGGGALGLLLGGVLTEYASWRWTLLIGAPIAVAAAVAALRIVRDSRAEGRPRYDLPGAVTGTAGLVALVYGFSVAGTEGWRAPATVVALVAALLLLAGFVVIEVRAAEPMLPMRVVVDRNRGGAYLARLLVGVAIFGVFLFLTYYLQQTLGYAPLQAGVAFLPFTCGIVVGSVLAVRAMPRLGPRLAMLAGLASSVIGMCMLTRVGVHTGYWSHVLPAEMVLSVGMGLTFGPLSSTALIGIEDRDAGVASALVNTAQQVGGTLGTALLNTIATTAAAGYVVAHSGGGRPPVAVHAEAVTHGYTFVFGVSALLLIAAVLTTAALVNEKAGGREPVPAH
jgi:EmrB/QacA subfamily drug resistance transporter